MSLGRGLSKMDLMVEVERVRERVEAVLEEVVVLSELVCLVAEKVGVDDSVLKELCLAGVGGGE